MTAVFLLVSGCATDSARAPAPAEEQRPEQRAEEQQEQDPLTVHRVLADDAGGDWRLALDLVRQGADFSNHFVMQDGSAQSVLSYAVERNYYTLARELIERGAPVNDTFDPVVHNPLHKAASNNNIAMLDLLLRNGADVNLVDHQGLPAFFEAVVNGHFGATFYLLHQTPPDTVFAVQGNTFTPVELALALRNGVVSAEQRPADVLWLALYQASMSGSLDAVPQPTLNFLVGEDYTVLNYYTDRQDYEAVVDLLARGAVVHDPLMVATAGATKAPGAEADTLDYVRLFVEHGANVDAMMDSGLTALANAAVTGNVKVVAYLIDSGADVNKRGVGGRTPLMFAVDTSEGMHPGPDDERLEVVQLLVESGADLHAQDVNGMTVMDVARQTGQVEIRLWGYLNSVMQDGS